MSRRVIPMAEAAGAEVVTECRATALVRRGSSVVGVRAERRRNDGRVDLVYLAADHVFVCAGPTETPALLRRSGIKTHVGDTFLIHPMLKVAALFPETIDAHRSVLPLLQVKEFWPEITLGGSFFTPGHLAIVLSDNWPQWRSRLGRVRNMASYYVAVRGSGHGSIRSTVWDERPVARYDVSARDFTNLSTGLARLSMLLLAAGAEEVYPAVHGLESIRTDVQASRWLDENLACADVSLTTVHAFSSCPIGERRDRCAADSFGRVHDFTNLYVNDASMLPHSPGVNPMGSVMAFARRNALHFCERQ
jgi:choline dehydrogenase-like flavoprotein